MGYIEYLKSNVELKILIIIIVLDVVFGCLRAIKQRCLNSCIGIDGIIRKCGMVISILFFFAIDFIIGLNLIGFIPEDLSQMLNLGEIGIGSLFGLLFIIFELMSVLKNMHLCELPVPKKLQNFFEKVLCDFTSEVTEEKKGDK